MTTQANIKLDAKLKKEAEKLAEEFGLTLSGILRALLLQFVRTKRLNLSLEEEGDTPNNMTGKKLEQILIKDGWNPKRARQHGKAYDSMLKDEKEGKLIRIA